MLRGAASRLGGRVRRFSGIAMDLPDLSGSGMPAGGGGEALAAADPAQRELMGERVLVVDTNDNPIGVDTKVNTHLIGPDGGTKLHRAFSVFWFSADGRKMLLQQRASCKVTFPSYWTNACCSHPLYTPSEYKPNNDPVLGVKNAAIRKLSHELGTPPGLLNPDQFMYMTRIHYQSPSDCGVWGEHEIDYVLLLKTDYAGPGVLTPNEEEVDDLKMVSPTELRAMFEQADAAKIKLTPWFRYIMESFVFEWWPSIEKDSWAEELAKHKSLDQIHFLGPASSRSS